MLDVYFKINNYMKIELLKLSFDLKSLEPTISYETIDYHYWRHHKTYLDNLNKLIMWTEFENLSLEEIVKKAPKGPIFNNAAQVWNHNFYFEQFSSKNEHIPNVELYDKIDESFGKLDNFKEEFKKMALSNFWSGWTWLVYNLVSNELMILNTSNADNYLWDNNLISLLVCDVWEHAYYIDYRNNRGKYLDNFWNIVDWKIIEDRFKSL